MELRVLGPIVAHENGTSFVPSATKAKKVLVLLILNANRIVPVATLQKELWGEEPPPSAVTTLQTYILQLRKLLGLALPNGYDGAKEVLVTMSTGYMFKPTPGSLDLDLYHRLTREAQVALDLGDNETGSRLLTQALDLWEGEALVDVHAGPIMEGYVLRLAEARFTALELRLEADLHLGRHHQILSELSELTAEYPFNENLHALLMTALYRSGRRGQTLLVYQNLRKRLVDNLGLEPSLRLRGLQQAVLACDPKLDYHFPSTITG